jgi:acyl-coenzyme A synthetase/AMP-(fatty) acid ligase
VSRHGILLQVRFVEELMKTSVGKLNKRAMRESVLGQPADSQAS